MIFCANKVAAHISAMGAISLLLTSSCACANPAYDHIVVVIEENHSYEQIVGSPDAPYINNKLIKEGVLIKNAYGEQHPSQPNYFWLFSGNNQGITYDTPYWSYTNPQAPAGPIFNSDNLYTALEQKFSPIIIEPSNLFGGYVDSGTSTPISNYYDVTDKGVIANYANRHVPWLGFTNINKGNPAGITKDFGTTFPSGADPKFDQLPKLSFVIPALNHDMHDYDSLGHGVSNPKNSSIAVRNGDQWLQKNLNAYAEWAKMHNSLLIITFDEDSTADWATPVKQGGGGGNHKCNPYGLTSPKLRFNSTSCTSNAQKTSGKNHIPMIFYGANLSKRGGYSVPGVGVNNVNLLRTIESFYNLNKSGAQSPLAIKAGMTDKAITGIFTGSSD